MQQLMRYVFITLLLLSPVWAKSSIKYVPSQTGNISSFYSYFCCFYSVLGLWSRAMALVGMERAIMPIFQV